MNKLQRWSIGVDLEKGFYQRQDDNGDWIDYKEAADLIEQLQQRNAELEKERNELAAAVERLFNASMQMLNSDEVDDDEDRATIHDNLNEALITTPQANLNAIKLEVYADGFYDGYAAAWDSNQDYQQDHIKCGLELSEIEAGKQYPTTEGE